MNTNQKKILVGAIIVILVIIVVAVLTNRNKGKNTKNVTNNVANEEFVQNLADGTKLNTSNKLKETKTIDGLEVGNIQLTEKNNVTELIVDIKNSGTTKKGGYPVTLTILDKNGNTITKLDGFLGEVQPGAKQQMSVSATTDLANAYDFTIQKE